MDRRNVLLGGCALGSALAIGTGRSEALTRDRGFPKGFRWGCATAAYQIEGAVAEDGRGRTNWDVFSHMPGRIAGGDSGDVATDSYHRHVEDLSLLRSLGVNSHRFSIAWSRIFPDGRGQVNQKGVDHYDRIVDEMLAAGIEPYVTLFHWDLPAALPGGWQNRDTATALADYAGFMAGKLSDRVRSFMTINEFRCFTDLGHQQGIHAPGLKLPARLVNQVRHHGVLGHGLSVQAIRASARSGTHVGVADNPSVFAPVIETTEHIVAARRAFRERNAMFLTAVMEGRYLDGYLAEAGADAPKIQSGDMAVIGSPLDFVALNIYSTEWARADQGSRGYAIVPHDPAAPRMASPWLVVAPESAYWGVRHVGDLWTPKAMFISENGASLEDHVVQGRIDDADRIAYLRNYLAQFGRAIDEGCPLRGYFLWSLLDNFEWADGYGKRFGLHHVDFATQRRTPKLSAAWYREVIRQNRLL